MLSAIFWGKLVALFCFGTCLSILLMLILPCQKTTEWGFWRLTVRWIPMLGAVSLTSPIPIPLPNRQREGRRMHKL